MLTRVLKEAMMDSKEEVFFTAIDEANIAMAKDEAETRKTWMVTGTREISSILVLAETAEDAREFAESIEADESWASAESDYEFSVIAVEEVADDFVITISDDGLYGEDGDCKACDGTGYESVNSMGGVVCSTCGGAGDNTANEPWDSPAGPVKTKEVAAVAAVEQPVDYSIVRRK